MSKFRMINRANLNNLFKKDLTKSYLILLGYKPFYEIQYIDVNFIYQLENLI